MEVSKALAATATAAELNQAITMSQSKSEAQPATAGRRTTPSGIEIPAVATAAMRRAPDDSAPGEYPFTRGIFEDGYRGRLWTFRQYSGFGSAEECWAIARACSEALTLVFHFHEQPVFRELWLKLPRAQSWHRTTTLTGEVRLRSVGSNGLEVIAADGTPIDEIAFSGPAAGAKRKAYAEDWATLLRAQGLTARQESIEVAPCPVA